VVDKGPGVYVNGASYDVVSALGVTGGFASEQLPAPTGTVSFGTNQTATAFQVRANVASFASVAGGGSSAGIAGALDRLAPSATGELASAIESLQRLSRSELRRGVASLSPAGHAALGAASFDLLDRHGSALHTRMNVARSALRGTPLVEAIDRTELAQQAALARFGFTPLTLDLFADPAASPAAGPWLSGFGHGLGRRGEGEGRLAHRNAGIPVGFDLPLSPRLVAGVAAAQAFSASRLAQDGGAESAESVLVAAYGTWFTRDAELEGSVSYGRGRQASVRVMELDGAARHATSDSRRGLLAASVAGRYRLETDAVALEPFASLRYARVEAAGFEERGVGALDLVVAPHAQAALASQAGVRIVRSFERPEGTWVPELTLSGRHELAVGGRSIAASLRGAEQERFRVESPDAPGGSFALGAALAFQGRGGFSAAAGVGARIGSGGTDAAATLQLQYRW
jgi:outer membrane autotransporter protein